MEKNPIMAYLEALTKLPGNNSTTEVFKDLYQNTHLIKITPLKEVFTPKQIELIRLMVTPKPKQCYRNAALLAAYGKFHALGDMGDIKYVEGYMYNIITMEHAFNKIGDKYIDITLELALEENPAEFYASSMELSGETVINQGLQQGYWGSYCYEFYLKKNKR